MADVATFLFLCLCDFNIICSKNAKNLKTFTNLKVKIYLHKPHLCWWCNLVTRVMWLRLWISVGMWVMFISFDSLQLQLNCAVDEGVYVDTYGKIAKNVVLQWGEPPTSVGVYRHCPLSISLSLCLCTCINGNFGCISYRFRDIDVWI